MRDGATPYSLSIVAQVSNDSHLEVLLSSDYPPILVEGDDSYIQELGGIYYNSGEDIGNIDLEKDKYISIYEVDTDGVIVYSNTIPIEESMVNIPDEEPENPTDPGGENPTEPENPTDPADPTDPGTENPGEPGNENPTDPTDPGTENPGGDTENPTNPGEENPGGENPTDPTDPGTENPGGENPTDPGEENPGGEDPTDPGTENPTDPGTENPTDPGTENPTDPGEENPTDPGTGNPGEEIPTDPGTDIPTEPSTPNKPDDGNTTTPTDPGSIEKYGVVEGVIVDQNGNPISGVEVTLHSKVRRTFTDSKGRFKFENVEYGNHTLIINESGLSNIGKMVLQLISSEKGIINTSDSTEVKFSLDNLNVTVKGIVVRDSLDNPSDELGVPDNSNISDNFITNNPREDYTIEDEYINSTDTVNDSGHTNVVDSEGDSPETSLQDSSGDNSLSYFRGIDLIGLGFSLILLIIIFIILLIKRKKKNEKDSEKEVV